MRKTLVLMLIIAGSTVDAVANSPEAAPSVVTTEGRSLSGVWTLDHNASQGLSEVLKARGVSWAKRQAAVGMDMTLSLEDRGNALKVEQVTSARTQAYELRLDGVERQVESDGEVSFVQAMRDAGGVTVRMRPADGSKAPMSVHRAVQGGVLVQTMTVQPKGGAPVSARLVFNPK